MSTDSHRLKHTKDGYWECKRDGAQRASVRAKTKAEAESQGREISRNQHTEFIVYGLDGKIQRRDSHGNDPYPPKN